MAETELRRPCHSWIYAYDCGIDITTHRNYCCLSTNVGKSRLAQEGLVGRLLDVACDGNVPSLCFRMKHTLTASRSLA
jgi:hypothetical protein